MTKAPDLDTRLPTAGDSLFIAKDWAFDAHVVGDRNERFYRLPQGYKQAGDVIVLQAAGEPRQRANLIYPALYCYRQTIELWLKKLTKDYGHSVAFPPPPKGKRNASHDLAALWSRFEVVAASRNATSGPEFNAARELVLEMHKADEANDCFRYAADPKDNPFAFGDRNIDLENLFTCMAGLANFFESAEMMFEAQDDRP